MKTLERLRQMKAKAVERMQQLNDAAKKGGRDLSADEKLEYDAKKAEAEELDGEIKDLEAKLSAQTPAPAPASPVPAPAAPPAKDADTLKREGMEAEKARAKAIRDGLAAAKLPAERVTALEKELIEGNATVEAASAKIVAAMAELAGQQPDTRGGLRVQKDGDDKFREALVASLMHRHNPAKSTKEEVEMSRPWMGATLMELARECLRRKGERNLFGGPGEVAQLALTTSDFSNILADVSNKTLRMGYENYPNTFQAFCRRATANDFKNINRVQLSGAPALLKVNENGEIEQGVLTDGKETYKLVSYGRILHITRRTIINDDLGAFTRIPELMGRKAAILEGDIVWALVTANGNMADGNAVFSSSHANYTTGPGTAISVDSVGVGGAMMAVQTGLEGDTLNLYPEYLVVPKAKQILAEKLVAPINIAVGMTNAVPDVVPASISRLKVVGEPRLDANSATAWYMFAGAGQVDTIEYCYLAGQEGMRFETQMGFEVDGVKFKAAHDFGAGVIDYRGLYKNAGA